MAIPPLFTCPISLDLFKDPVTLCTGQTYDRGSIEKWLATGNLTCPVTMQKLQDTSLVPNHTLRHLISEWMQHGRRLGHHFVESGDFEFDFEFSFASIRGSLESHETSLENKLQVLAKIQELSKESRSNNKCLSKLGLFSLLMELVFGENTEENLKFVEQGLVCVVMLLPFSEYGSLNMLKEECKLARFQSLFTQGNVLIKKSLCQLVEAISSSLYTKELCNELGKRMSLLQEIVMLLRDNTDNASESAIKCISALCSSESNKENLVQASAIQGLVTYILGYNKRSYVLAPMAMATLEVLLGLESGRNTIICCPKGVNAIVKMVFRVSDHEGSDSAIGSLMIVCGDSVRAREEAICAGVLTQLLLLLQSQCSESTKTKARMLLKLLS